jgi:hypothetical protein
MEWRSVLEDRCQVMAIADMTLWVRWAKNKYHTLEKQTSDNCMQSRNRQKTTIQKCFYIHISHLNVLKNCWEINFIKWLFAIAACLKMKLKLSQLRLYFFIFWRLFFSLFVLEAWFKFQILVTPMYWFPL